MVCRAYVQRRVDGVGRVDILISYTGPRPQTDAVTNDSTPTKKLSRRNPLEIEVPSLNDLPTLLSYGRDRRSSATVDHDHLQLADQRADHERGVDAPRTCGNGLWRPMLGGWRCWH